MFDSISASIGRIFLKLHSLHFPRMRYKRCTFVCYWSITKGTLLEKKSNSSAVSGFHSSDFPIFTYLAPSMHALQMV